MPLTGLVCRSCGGARVPFTHFETTTCGLTTLDPRYARASVDHELGRYSYGSKSVSVTQIINCPRQGAIQSTEDWWLDPLAMNAAYTGVAWGNFLDSGKIIGDWRQVCVKGIIQDVTITGQIDLWRPSQQLIVDDKNQNDFSRADIEKNGAKPEHVAQISLYAELMRQSLGKIRDDWDGFVPDVEPKQGRIDYHWSTKDGMKMIPVEFWTLERILEFKPHDGAFTVRENLVNSQKPWREQPLTGESIIFSKSGKTLCDGCQVREICHAQAHGATF